MKEIGKHTEVTKCENVVTIKIKGDFKFKAHQEFRKAYLDNIGSDTKWILDFSQSQYVDSAALGMLLIFREEAISQHKNSTVELINTNVEVKKILEVTNFQRLFKIK